MTTEELDKLEEIDKASINEKGIKYSKYSFTSKEMKDIKGKMEEVTMTRLHEKYSLLFDGGISHISHQGKDCFSAICFNADLGKLKIQAEGLRNFLLEEMAK